MINTVDETISLKELGVMIGKIKLDPKFQRNEVWSRRMQTELFTSVVERVSLPKIYLRRGKNGRSAVIDGKQRLIALTNLLNGDLKPLGYEWTYKSMPADVRKQVDKFPISLVWCDGSDVDIRTIFKRLNSGKPLTINEKNHADYDKNIYPVIWSLQGHEIVNILNISTNRYQHEQWISQCCALIWQYMSLGSIAETIGNKYKFPKLEKTNQKNKLEATVRKVFDLMEVNLSPFDTSDGDIEGLPAVKTPQCTELFWMYFKLSEQVFDLTGVNGKDVMKEFLQLRDERADKDIAYNNAVRVHLLDKESVPLRMKFVEDYIKKSSLLKKPFALSL